MQTPFYSGEGILGESFYQSCPIPNSQRVTGAIFHQKSIFTKGMYQIHIDQDTSIAYQKSRIRCKHLFNFCKSHDASDRILSHKGDMNSVSFCSDRYDFTERNLVSIMGDTYFNSFITYG